MKLNWLVVFIILAAVIAVPPLNAATNDEQSKAYQQGMVLSVEKQEIKGPGFYYSGTDVPVQSEYYAYDVSVRLGCVTYSGRYETPFDYLPSAFSAGKPIQVHVAKHVMHLARSGAENAKEFVTRGKEGCRMAKNSGEQL